VAAHCRHNEDEEAEPDQGHALEQPTVVRMSARELGDAEPDEDDERGYEGADADLADVVPATSVARCTRSWTVVGAGCHCHEPTRPLSRDCGPIEADVIQLHP
jgi:hypothetical protein